MRLFHLLQKEKNEADDVFQLLKANVCFLPFHT